MKNVDSKTISIEELRSLEDFDLDGVITRMGDKLSNFSREEQEHLAYAFAKQRYQVAATGRINFSEEANEIMEKIKRGYTPNKDDFFILNSDEQWLNEHRKTVALVKDLEDIRERVSKGYIDSKDMEYLLETMGVEENQKEVLRQAFALKGILIPEYEEEKTDEKGSQLQ